MSLESVPDLLMTQHSELMTQNSELMTQNSLNPTIQRRRSMSDPVREQLLALLRGGQAHAAFDDVIKDFPPKLRGAKPDGAPHTAWQLLEHMRIAQSDILEFSRDAK